MELILERQWKRQGGSCFHRAVGEAGAPRGWRRLQQLPVWAPRVMWFHCLSPPNVKPRSHRESKNRCCTWDDLSKVNKLGNLYISCGLWKWARTEFPKIIQEITMNILQHAKAMLLLFFFFFFLMLFSLHSQGERDVKWVMGDRLWMKDLRSHPSPWRVPWKKKYHFHLRALSKLCKLKLHSRCHYIH